MIKKYFRSSPTSTISTGSSNGSLIIILLTVALLVGLPTKTLQAQSLKIVDCNGSTRAFKRQVTPNNNNIRVDLVDQNGVPLESGEVNLLNAEGKIVNAAIANGTAEFSALEPGVWMISSPNSGVFFTKIALTEFIAPPFWQSAGVGLGKAAEIALVIGAVVGAAVIVDEVSDSNGGGDGDDSVSPPSDVCLSCDSDAIAPTIPDFE
jgi:hypothetical protein